MQDRLRRLRAKLDEKSCDAILVTQPENRRYMSGFTGSSGYLVVSQGAAVLLTDFRYTEQAGLQSPDYQVRQISYDFATWFPQLMGELSVARLAFDKNHVSYGMHQVMVKALGEAKVELAPDDSTIELLRAVKEPAEIAALERAQALTDQAFEHVEARLRPGMTEGEIAWELEKYIREHGGEGLAFDTIVGAGPNGARPHHRAGDTPIKEGEPIVIDMGARVDGYCADMTRTVYLGAQDDQFKKVYDIVLGAQLTAEALIKAGITGDEADGYARKLIEDAGYGETFGHSLGHGIGLFVHEHPRLAKKAENVLEDGMVFSVEPGIYITGWGGVRIEDLVVLENGKPRVLAKAHKLRTK
ncbi:MAG: aminopeptidase P family protein [Chloroflexi bacterium]|nr:aminopeptidase P family protein [Chloroflexota bacterium]